MENLEDTGDSIETRFGGTQCKITLPSHKRKPRRLHWAILQTHITKPNYSFGTRTQIQWRRLQSSPTDPNELFIFFWNCQDIGPTLTVHGFGSLIRKFRPDVVFLSEMRGPSHCIESLKRNCNLHGVGVRSISKSGGLALLCSKNIQFDLVSYSAHHMDTKIRLFA